MTLGLQGGGNLPGADSLARKFRYADLDGHGLQGVPPIRYLLYYPFTRLGLGSTGVTALFRVSGPLSAGLRAGWGAKKTLVSQKRAPRPVHSNAPSPWPRPWEWTRLHQVRAKAPPSHNDRSTPWLISRLRLADRVFM